MREPIVELIRRLEPLSSRTGFPDHLFVAPGRSLRWHDVQDQYRVLVLADPGAGKTFEALLRARKLRERGRKAFFLRIEAIDESFPEAFEEGTSEEFLAWLASAEDAWFFLDSVDEAQLETPRSLERAIQVFGSRIHGARDRAHIFITSREDAWQALPDRTLVEQYLPFGSPPKKGREKAGRPADPMLKLYRLAGLSEDEIREFAAHYGVHDVSAFVEVLRRGNLMTLAERPFDLKALLRVWKSDRALGSRFDVLRRLVELELTPLFGTVASASIDAVRVRGGIRALAGAVTLTGTSVICLPGGLHGRDRIDPRSLLPDWTEPELDALLRSGVFDDVVYTGVRFRHREVRELLCAEWANDLLGRDGGRERVERLFFRESYGEQVVVPRTRPVLPWLILMDEGVRNRALAIAPEIASEGGDPSQLPLGVRRTMLADVVRRIATGEK